MANIDRDTMEADVEVIIDRSDLTSQVDRRLQWAMDYVGSARGWKALESQDTSLTLVTNQKNYTIPTNYKSISSMRFADVTDENGTYLHFMENDEFLEKHPYVEGELTGPPVDWCRVGSEIWVAPDPSSEENGEKLYFIGRKRNTPFTAGSDTSDMDQELDEAIICIACWKMFRVIGEEEIGQVWLGDGEAIIGRVWQEEQVYAEGAT